MGIKIYSRNNHGLSSVCRYKIPFLFFCLLACLQVHTQVITTGAGNSSISGTGSALRDFNNPSPAVGSYGGQQTFIALTARGGLKLPGFESISGSPFLHPEYNQAQVRVKSGFSASNISVKFNIWGNEVIFLQNKNELALDSVDFVTYTAVGKSGEVETVILKTGFPATGQHTVNTIYQVLDSGARFQLLKYHYQRLGEVKALGTAPTKEFVNYHELYVYSPKEGMKKIKADLKSLQEAIPGLADQIEKIVADKKLKLKKENDIVLLFQALNNVSKAF